MSDSPKDHVQVVPLGRGRYLVTSGGDRQIAFAAGTRDVWVFVSGRTYLVADREKRRARSHADGNEALTAPMPATVLAIHVKAGDHVQRDDVLIVLEAMKMELPIRAPRGGVVKDVTCAAGELVQAGATLLEIRE